MVGQSISHYKIVSELGRGGMGIVYEAEDTRLHRTVAIKVLPAAALSNEDDRARFYREARAAASLTHPHIAVVHEIDEAVPEGSEKDDLRPFIAMEFIEGETLHDRIQKGPLKLEEAVRIESQIASGLEAAHEKNIVHRDIKSQNVMLTAKGEAKILDFGLAQTAASTKLTRMGSTLGTVAYMSPEQARGEEVDLRTDLWSLGVVLYEMIAGRSPFPGDYEQAVVYEILNTDPEPLTAVRTGVPMQLEWLVNKLLAKSADERYQSATGLLVDLKTINLTDTEFSRLSGGLTSSSKRSHAPRELVAESEPAMVEAARKAWPIITASVLCAVLVGYLWGQSSMSDSTQTETGVTRFEIEVSQVPEILSTIISRDGKRVIFVGSDSVGTRLYSRPMDTAVESEIEGTRGAVYPSLSPDGNRVVFVSGRNLQIVNVNGGIPTTLTTNVSPHRTYWGDDGFIYYRDVRNSILRIDPDVGDPQIISLRRTDTYEHSRGYTSPITDSNWLLFSVRRNLSLRSDYISGLNTSTGAERILIDPAFQPILLSSDHLLYSVLEDDGIKTIAVPFNRTSLEVRGLGVPVLEVSSTSYSVSDNGTLVHLDPDHSEDQLILLAENGQEQVLHTESNINFPQISPDGSQVLINRFDKDNQVWLLEIDSGQFRPIASGDSIESTATWHPNGSKVIYGAFNDGIWTLMEVATSGATTPKILWRTEYRPTVTSWSADGNVAFYVHHPERKRDLWVYSETDSLGTPFYETENNETAGVFSNSGKWIAFHSDESGRNEIWVKPYPKTDAKIQITSDGGKGPRWSPNDDRIFFFRGTSLMEIPVASGGNFEILGPPQTVASGYKSAKNLPVFDVFPDGKRFIVLKTDSGQPQNRINVVLNWFEELNRLVPTSE